MLDRYASALRLGDFEAAMAERCSTARVSDANRQLFVAQGEALTLDTGRLSVVAHVPATVKVRPSDTTREPIYFDYVINSAIRTSAPMHGVAVYDDSKLKFCGYAQPDVEASTRMFSTAPDPAAQPTRATRELLPTDGPAGFNRSGDDASTSLSGAVEGWVRTWRPDGFGGAAMTVIRYPTAQTATDKAREEALGKASDVTETFDVPGMPNARAFRYAGSAWTWLQAPKEGYDIDSIVAVYGNTVVKTEVTVKANADHTDVLSLARAADALARPG